MNLKTPAPVPVGWQQEDARFYRYTTETEGRYLARSIRKDAWRSLYQWLLPALALSALSLGYWLYRQPLQNLLRGADNPREFSIFIGFVWNFFLFLLHLALVIYLIKLQRMLRYFSKKGSASAVAPLEPANWQLQPPPTSEPEAGAPMETQVETQGEPSKRYAIYRIEGSPRSILNLVLTSRSGLRRYRWHYYLGELPLTPLPLQRKALPLYVQKKSWQDLGKLSRESLGELLPIFPGKLWLELCLECQRLQCKLRIDIVPVSYYDFRFYYLCALDAVPARNNVNAAPQVCQLHSAATLLEQGAIADLSSEYRISP